MSAFARPGAYDYNNTVFSPDGRLYQVEYARELVNRGGTIVGIRCAEGVVLGSEENAEVLEEVGRSWKIFQVDEHIGAAIIGLGSDARVLIDQARLDAQSNKLTYDEPIDVEVATQKICDTQQTYTQHGGGRPFGVAMILGGVDKTGLPILKEMYREDLTLEEGVKLAVKCLVKALQARELPLRVKIAVIPVATKKWDMLSDEAVKGYIKEAS